MESLLTATATTNLYKETWPVRLTQMGQVISLWTPSPDPREKASSYLRCRCPIWVDGFSGQEEIRKSLDITN